MGDITLRALEILGAVDLLATEDSRVTQKLLHNYSLSPKLVSYHEHNEGEMRPVLLAALAAGQAVGLVSDAGTPLVSDPGYKLVEATAAAGHPVYSIPGASAVLTALTASGLPTNRFMFAGFMPPKSAARREELASLAAIPTTLIFFESPQRLADSLKDMAELMGPRPAVVARELTKLFEEVRRGTLPQLAAHYAEAGAPKGEIVIVIGPPDTTTMAAQDVDALLVAELATRTLRDAVAVVTAQTGKPKRDVYARAVALTQDRHG